MRPTIPVVFVAVLIAPLVTALGQDQGPQGQKTYAKTCAVCHASGAAGAPELTDAAAWQARLNKGKAKLYDHAIGGIGAMPAKGGNAGLRDGQIKAAVDYMLAQVSSGAGKAGAEAPKAQALVSAPLSGLQISPSPGKPIKNPYAGDPAAIGRGVSLFTTMNCAGCHAPKAGGGMGPPLTDSTWLYGNEPADLYRTIAQGRPNGMPAFGGVLSGQSIWSLVAYIETL